MSTAPIAITGRGVISPFGVGNDAFAEGLRADRPARRAQGGLGPAGEACTLEGFEASRYLGSKGTRVLDRTMGFAITATGLALQDAALPASPQRSASTGLVLGTSNGSPRSTFEYTRETLVGKKPYLVSPELFPNTVMNGAAGQCAIWHQLRAVNTTLSGGRMAGLLALRYASRMLRLEHADVVVAGGVEEFSQEMAWASQLAADAIGEPSPVLGEGCAMFVLQRSSGAPGGAGRPRAELLACEVRLAAAATSVGSPLAGALGECIGRALASAGVAPQDVWAVSRRRSGLSALDEAEDSALARALGGREVERPLDIARLVGECFSASGALQLAALLEAFERDGRPGRVGIVTSLAHGGGVGCAVVRGA